MPILGLLKALQTYVTSYKQSAKIGILALREMACSLLQKPLYWGLQQLPQVEPNWTHL